jgi:hypothetical protein
MRAPLIQNLPGSLAKIREDKGTDGTTPNEIDHRCSSASKDKAHHASTIFEGSSVPSP